MAFKTNGVVRIASNGGANLGLTTATEFDGKVSEKAITEQTDGAASDVSEADELLIYDSTSTDLIRVTVDEFVEGAGIATVGSDLAAASLTVAGVTTMSDHLIIDDGTGAGTEYALNVKTTGTSRFGVLGNGAVLLGNSSASPFIAVNDHHATSKKYVDDAITSAAGASSDLVVNGLVVSGVSTLTGQTFLGDTVNNDAGATVHTLGILYTEAGLSLGDVSGLEPDKAVLNTKFGNTNLNLELNENLDLFDITYKKGFDVPVTLVQVNAGTDPYVSVGCSIIPDTNITYDLGSDTKRFRDLYLEGNTIYLGDTEISADTVVTTTNVGTATTGDQLAWDGTAWSVSSAVVAGVGGGSICLKFKSSTDTTMTDPGSGKFRLNNATQENSTQLVISVKTDGGYNINSLLSNVVVGAKLFLQRKDKPDQYYAFIVNAVPTITGSTSTGYYTFSDVTGTANGSAGLENNKECIVCIKAPDQVSGETITPSAVISGSVTLGTGGPSWTSGTGSPESSVTAPVGSLYSRTDGGADTTLYVKESGTGNTGWIAK